MVEKKKKYEDPVLKAYFLSADIMTVSPGSGNLEDDDNGDELPD